jgi:phosphoribosylanthranilate isomerase
MNARTRIKVCGMREAAEVAAVVAAGVDAVGFIFVAASPRRVEPETVRAIVRTLPPFVDAVGVFVDQEAAVVNEIVQYCGLTKVQLHGSESPEFCREIDCRVLKAFRVGAQTRAEDLQAYAGEVSAFLLDSYQEGVAGGTGKTFAWDIVARLQPPGPVILAGGLTPDNVGEAILQVRPFAVDFNSGVELAPGHKDPALVRQAVERVAAADLSLRR